MLESAKTYLNAGLCVLPARRAEKRPAVRSWKQYQERLPTEAELSAWFANGPDSMCVLCGRTSGNLEIIDFDAGGERFEPWKAKIQEAAPGLFERLVVERTPSGGYHVVYRCEAGVCGNLKLAQRRIGKAVVTLIETRGEGGLFLCAPTFGYELTQGDLADPPVLAEADRDVLLQAAWELNEYVPPVVDFPTHSSGGGPVGQRPASSAAQGGMSAEISDKGDCSSNNAVVGQTSPLCVAQGDLSADSSNIGGCASHNGPVGRTGGLCVEQRGGGPHKADRPGDDFNSRGNPADVLKQHGWVRVSGGANEYWRRPGKAAGWSATLKECSGGRVFYVFSANAAPFEPNRAYSPFAVYTMLNHGGDFEAAAGALRAEGYGVDALADARPGVDISGIMRMSVAQAGCPSNNPHIGDCAADNGAGGEHVPHKADPGPMPDEMLRVPGFVSEVMDHCLATAPYPNQAMAFAGALSLLAFLAGRKVRDSGDNRTNIYLLGLAHSSAGKDWPRKVNTRVVHEVGLASALGERFASGEGIQDAMLQTPSMLFQTDEIDGMLQSINKAKDARHEAIMSTLLTMYSSANSVFPMRRKASGNGKPAPPTVIDQPCLVIFGTAIPNHYYEALSERMLTNGFFARMIILEAGPRNSGQEPSIRTLPDRVVATAKWWSEFRPGKAKDNLFEVYPNPVIVEHTDDARRVLVETREQAEAEYAKAEAKNDSVGTTVWGRVSEQTRKLSLLYAVSENHQSPRIGIDAVVWASRFVLHQTRRMLFMAQAHVAENPFHAECLKAIEKLRAAPGNELPHSVLLKRMKTDAKSFAVLIETLCQQGEVVAVTTPRAGSYLRSYRLTAEVNPEGER